MAAAVAVVLTGIAVVGLATAKSKGPKPLVVRAGNMVLTLNGDVEPKTLPKHEFAPLGFWGSAKLATVDGSHPPALDESLFDVDKDVVIDVTGLPACRIGQLEARETKKAEAVCGDAILGRGTATVEVAFPEQEPFDSTGPLIFFNGGERHGVVKVLAYAYVSVPAPTAVIATAEIKRVSKGAYGLRVETEFPRIAGGAGSVVAARFSMRRVYTYKGRRRSVISGRCRDGRLQARGVFDFSDDSVLSGSIFRTCTAVG
ncbi:MAG TPA: hypothetical protein VNC16_09120 [Solirubrobacterales bacterium]|jgi:hypothetical protein|nr:hypothetical protein [Solirubrobacterales bacterium]